MKKLLLNSMALPLFVFFVIFPIGFSHAQKNPANSAFALFEQVAPNAYVSTAATGTFLGPYANSARTYQMLVAASELTNLVGKHLTSISFRSTTSSSAAWPTADVTFANFDIYLSGSVDPANRSLTFANNIVGTQTQVRSGSLLIPANSVTFGANPNAFSFDVNFTTPWTYSGGNLLIEIRHPGFTGVSKSLEAVLATPPAPGYGTLFSGCWTGNYTGTAGSQGNFCVVNLKATDVLGVQNFDAPHWNVYPNPTSDELHIDGNVVITKVTIFNMLGQMVLEKPANGQTNTIDLSHLNSGTYVLEMETELGIKKQKIIKN